MAPNDRRPEGHGDVPDHDGPYPLSSAQEQLWYLEQSRPDSVEHLLPRAWRIDGPLVVEALRNALDEIVARHEVLRTRYVTSGSTPAQVVDRPSGARFTYVDLSDLEHTAREATSAERIDAETRTPFDLRNDAPFRALLIRHSPTHHILLMTAHHVAFDGSSWPLLGSELSALYRNAVDGTQLDLPPMPLQYVDYALWQRDLAATSTQHLQGRLDYWRQRLADLPQLDLPADCPRPVQWRADGGSVPFTVPPELREKLAAIGRERAATPFMVLLAAFQVLLGRYARTNDVTVAVSASVRDRPELRHLAGAFVNTVLLRARLARGRTFADLLDQVRESTLDAYSHRDVPFDRVLAELAPVRDLAGAPLCQVGFMMDDGERPTIDLPHLEVRDIVLPLAGSAFDLSLHLTSAPDGSWAGQFGYPDALFDRWRVESIATHYSQLLRSIAAAPNAALHQLDVLTDSETEQLLGWGTTEAGDPEAPLPDLFHRRAQATPTAIAVVSDEGRLTYAELAAAVDDLAAHLRAAGVRQETRVGVAVGRSTDLVVSLLAVLTAGGVYVPLDPDQPTNLLDFVLDDAGVTVLLTQESVRRLLPPSSAHAIVLDAPRPAGALTDRPRIDPAAAAYVMYTSGSTGAPKGVVVTHAGIANRVLWSVRTGHVAANDRVLQKTAIGFDASVWEFLAPLVAGGALVVGSRHAHRDPAAIVRAIVAHDVTVLQVVPSVLRLLIRDAGLASCRSLRLVCSAGEPLPAQLCEELRRTLRVEVLNTYGPTECSIDVAAWDYHSDDDGEIVPIGLPLPNTRVYVVDDDGLLVPVGVPGELRVGGVSLSRGYRNKPELTAGRFTPNPFATEPGERWYGTGDLVRWRPDGVLEYLGRTDRQVKVHGVRVEPAGVEAALVAHPLVDTAAVTTYRSPSGDLELAGYLVPAGTAPLDVDRIRTDLGTTLPAAMIPAKLLSIDRLPLTANGKVDRTALPADHGELSPVSARVPPRTDTERTIAGIWADVLGRDPVGAQDDFFEIGGHSLTAIRTLLRLRRAFNVELTLDELLSARTVAGAAKLVDSANGAHGAQRIGPVPSDGPLPLSFGQRRLWFLDQLEPGSIEYLVPISMWLRGLVDLDVLRRALDELVHRHAVLRTRYVADHGDPRQVIDPNRGVELTFADVSTRPEPELAAREVAGTSHRTPFDLEHDHPIRVLCVRLGDESHLLALTMHHIALDAWSTEILLREFGALYTAFAAGRPSPLPPLAIRYADFAAWQTANQSEQDDQLEYWRRRLAGLEQQELLTDRPRPALRDPRGAEVVVDVPAQLCPVLAELCAERGATLFMGLLAAFQVLLARYTRQTDIVVGTPVAGRTRPETEDLVGFFVNTLVLRVDLTDRLSFSDLLGQVKRTTVEAFAHQDVPFERLVDVLQPERDLSRNPLFQVMFELQHHDPGLTALGAAAVRPEVIRSMVAKFDLTLTVEQHADGRLRCHFEFATSLFDRSTIERMAGNYLQLLACVGSDPSRPITDLLLVTDAEQEVLNKFAGHTAEPDGETVPELFQRQAALNPDAIAVSYGDDTLTYADLDKRSNQLAAHLHALGVGAESVVGVCLDRGPDVVVALLGVLKAGGAYVPFDPEHPADRIAFVVGDCGARIVLTNRRCAPLLAEAGATVIDLDQERPAIDARDAATQSPPASGAGLAYVIYTSGSTGRPKGVMVQHDSYAHHCRVIAREYDIRPEDRVVLLSALTFDVAMDQMGATLVAGATVVVSEPLFWSPAELPDRIADHGITIMEITPAHYREVLGGVNERDHRLRRLKLVNVGSDVVTADDARLWFGKGLPGRFLCNYGPTEATVTCLLHPVPTEPPANVGKVLPIGRPVPGTSVHVLDDAMRPAPIGVPGELYLGGVRLARGYLGRPALTADRFVPDPFGHRPGSRLYRTGDLVRYLADGTLVFLGRIDHQVKIRGFRIELGEIEAVLAEHPAVRAVVVAAKDVPDKRLVAYVVPHGGIPPDVGVLRRHLARRVPDHMIPSLWMTLDALPWTSSTKVDRTALPTPHASRALLGHAYVAPRTPVEQAIAEVWSTVLGVELVGVHDDFFHLGGHSLLATRVLAGLRDVFGVDIPLRLLFDATTVARLAEAVGAQVQKRVAEMSDAEVERLLKEGAS